MTEPTARHGSEGAWCRWGSDSSGHRAGADAGGDARGHDPARAQRLFRHNDGLELPLLYGAAAVALAFTGYGEYALDRMLGLGALSTIPVEAVALAIGALGGAAGLTPGAPRPSTG